MTAKSLINTWLQSGYGLDQEYVIIVDFNTSLENMFFYTLKTKINLLTNKQCGKPVAAQRHANGAGHVGVKV